MKRAKAYAECSRSHCMAQCSLVRGVLREHIRKPELSLEGANEIDWLQEQIKGIKTPEGDPGTASVWHQ